MKNDRSYVLHIIDSIDQIFEYTDQLSISEFKHSRLIQDAVIRNFEIIGEAAKQVSVKTRDELKKISWEKYGRYERQTHP